MGYEIVHELPKSPLKVIVSNGRKIRLALLVAFSPFLFSCASPEKPKVEAPPTAPAPVVDVGQPPQQMAKLPPPELASAQQVIKRIFKDSATIDTSQQPPFVSGDFNGDQSEDIAVVVKPAPDKLSDLNDEFANWIVRDPFNVGESRGPHLRVAANDVLLAVIHGYGSNGWRDPQATQTYLLKNAAGSGMEAQQPKDAEKMSPAEKRPHLRGDVIRQVVGGKPGYLYYVMASYSWYDPKTFKGDPEPGMFHGVADRKVKK